MPIRVNLKQCNDEICDFHRNEVVTADFIFSVQRPSKSATATAQALVNGEWIGLGVTEQICPNLVDGKCPLVVGVQYTYRNSVRVPPFAPIGFKTTVRVSAIDSENSVIACVQIAARIVR